MFRNHGTTKFVHRETRPPEVDDKDNPIVLWIDSGRGLRTFRLEEKPIINIDGSCEIIIVDVTNESYLFSINNIGFMKYTDDVNIYYQ